MEETTGEVLEQLRVLAAVLATVRGRLDELTGSLPEEVPGEEGGPGLRSIISCVLADSLDPAIRDLLRASEPEAAEPSLPKVPGTLPAPLLSKVPGTVLSKVPGTVPAAAPEVLKVSGTLPPPTLPGELPKVPKVPGTSESGYGGLWARLDVELPRLLAARDADRREAEALFLEILAVDGAARPAALEGERFRRSLLVDRLLEGAQAALPGAPSAAEELALLAGEVAGRLAEADEAVAGRVRASCWVAHARRLAGDRPGAEEALSEATLQVLDAGEQALLCRALALLRWEQGRLDEAAALLERAAELSAGEELPHEEGACRVLRALLAVDEGRARDAVGLLRTGLPLLADAWLTLYGGLALALGLAERGLDAKARAQRDESVRLMHASPRAAYLFALGLAGRIAASLGEHDAAEEQLEELRRQALERRWLPEAVLATFDLARLDGERGRDRDAAEARAADLEEAFGDAEPLESLLAALRADPLTAATRAIFLRTLRLRGSRGGPLPFT